MISHVRFQLLWHITIPHAAKWSSIVLAWNLAIKPMLSKEAHTYGEFFHHIFINFEIGGKSVLQVFLNRRILYSSNILAILSYDFFLLSPDLKPACFLHQAGLIHESKLQISFDLCYKTDYCLKFFIMHLTQPLSVLQASGFSLGQWQADSWLVLTQRIPHMLCPALGDHSHSVCGPALLMWKLWLV